MDEDTDSSDSTDQVLFDLGQMTTENLQRMARQHDLSPGGGRDSLLSRIREKFEFEDDEIQARNVSNKSKKKEKSSSASGKSYQICVDHIILIRTCISKLHMYFQTPSVPSKI